MRRLTHRVESLPIRGEFAIARGARTETIVIVVEIAEGDRTGRGECVPYARYGESVDSVTAQIESVAQAVSEGADRVYLQHALPAGAARNAVDCALWDLEAKQAGRRAWELAGVKMPAAIATAYTLSLGPPAAMAEAARRAGPRPLLKLKLDGRGDVERVAAVRAAAPRAQLIVDANEAWRPEQMAELTRAMAEHRVVLIEQPLPATDDTALAEMDWPVPICADEACHDRASLLKIRGKYDFINIKLDKTGGLTEALALAEAAHAEGLGLMVGCMLASSLSMAPATLVAARAAFVDLDGPLLLARDREPGLRYDGSLIAPPPPELWG